MSDDLKQRIAEAVFTAIGNHAEVEKIGGVHDVEMHPVSPLVATLRVRTANGAPRYFAIKLSEMQ